jgi:hypothetical protein
VIVVVAAMGGFDSSRDGKHSWVKVMISFLGMGVNDNEEAYRPVIGLF